MSRRFTFSAGTEVQIGPRRCRLVGSAFRAGAEIWHLEELETGLIEQQPRAELERRYAAGELNFVGSEGDIGITAAEARHRRKIAGTPHEHLPEEQRKRLEFKKAVVRFVRERYGTTNLYAKVAGVGEAPGTGDAGQADELGGPNGPRLVIHAALGEAARELAPEYGQKPHVSISAFRRWSEAVEEKADSSLIVDRHGMKGNRKQMDLEVKAIMQDVMTTIVQECRVSGKPVPKPMALIMSRVLTKVKSERVRTNQPDGLKLPSATTFYNQWSKFPQHDRDLVERGRGFVTIAYRGRRPAAEPVHALDVCQFDETRLPFYVVHDVLGIPLGRPWLGWFVDVHAPLVVGFHLGFQPPGDLVIASALRHACTPKSYMAEHYPELPPWPYTGIPRRVLFDNSMQAHGRTIGRIMANLDTPYEFAPRRTPHVKGTVEGSFNEISTMLLGDMKGFVLPAGKLGIEKADYDPLKDAVIGFWQLLKIVHHFLLTRFAHRQMQGTLSSPDQLWRDSVRARPPELLSSRRDADLLFGLRRSGVSLDNKGIRYEGLEYYSEHAARIRRTKGHKTEVEVLVNPSDLARIHVFDEELGWQPAHCLEAAYAEGMDLHQHQLLMRHARQLNGRHDLEARLEAAADMKRVIGQAVIDGASIGTAQLIARWAGIGSHQLLLRAAPSAPSPFTRPVPSLPLQGAGADRPQAEAGEQPEAGSGPQDGAAIPVFKTNHSLRKRS